MILHTLAALDNSCPHQDATRKATAWEINPCTSVTQDAPGCRHWRPVADFSCFVRSCSMCCYTWCCVTLKGFLFLAFYAQINAPSSHPLNVIRNLVSKDNVADVLLYFHGTFSPVGLQKPLKTPEFDIWVRYLSKPHKMWSGHWHNVWTQVWMLVHLIARVKLRTSQERSLLPHIHTFTSYMKKCDTWRIKDLSKTKSYIDVIYLRTRIIWHDNLYSVKIRLLLSNLYNSY